MVSVVMKEMTNECVQCLEREHVVCSSLALAVAGNFDL